MTILDKIKAIKKLQEVDAVWEFKRLFGSLVLLGDQLSVGKDHDYGSVTEFRIAVEWLVNELGGEVKWKKENKNETKAD